MKKLVVVLVLFAFMASGCGTETEWEQVGANAEVVDIGIVGAGGWGTPNSIRIWTLSDGRMISMSGWKNEDICIGDTVVKYKAISGACQGRIVWGKVSK